MQEAQSGAENVTIADLVKAGLRSGVLLIEDEQAIGVCELIPLAPPTSEEETANGGMRWQVRQLRLEKRSDHDSLFVFLLKAVINEAWRAGGIHLRVSPLDDITQPRPALPGRYDAANIGYASFYARAGFKRLEPVPASHWGIQHQ